jgi:hypothetical protein
MFHEHVELLEGALVEQKLDAFAGRQLALGMLRVDALLTAAEPRCGTPLLKLAKNFLHAAPLFAGWLPAAGKQAGCGRA